MRDHGACPGHRGADVRHRDPDYDHDLLRPDTSTSGLTGSTPVATATTTYDDATGVALSISDTSGTATTATDLWGRTTSYTWTPASGTAETTTTSYVPPAAVGADSPGAGQTASVTDPTVTTSWTYDGTTSRGVEHRGLTTGDTVTVIHPGFVGDFQGVAPTGCEGACSAE
jgi:hypothetical protein